MVRLPLEKPCLLFTGYLNSDGYGRLSRNRAAHRQAWQDEYGPVPKSMHVLHKCDVRNCIEPTHLFLGTHKDNMKDMNAKGRKASCKGEANPKAKLTVLDVDHILRSKFTQSTLAKYYGVTRQCIWRIKHGKTWAEKTPCC